MTEDDRRFLRDWDHQIGPTLDANYDWLKALDRVPVCAACPMAQWYKMESADGTASLECFCTTFRGVMYGPRRHPVTACDARVDALKSSDPADG